MIGIISLKLNGERLNRAGLLQATQIGEAFGVLWLGTALVVLAAN